MFRIGLCLLAQSRHTMLVTFFDRDRLGIEAGSAAVLRQRIDGIATDKGERVAVAALGLYGIALAGEGVAE